MKKQFIFIAYSFYPNREVGANRIRFWVEYLKRDYPQIEPVVLTATPFSEAERLTEQQHYIAEEPTGFLGLLIKDQGLKWIKPLIHFLEQQPFENVMGSVITGGPFMQFGVIETLKKVTGAKVAIDFRDPFAHNHRFGNSWIKKKIKAFFEKKFVEHADLVFCVNNDFFKTLVGFRNDPHKFKLIPNGFDEISMDEARKQIYRKRGENEELRLILTGKYYANASPLPLFEAMDRLIKDGFKTTFVHFGSSEDPSFLSSSYDFIIEKGVGDYSEVAKTLVNSDIGLVIIAGVDQNSPTKLFDYIGAELPILIITEGDLHAGNAHDITKNYPKVKWCKNDIIDIEKTLQTYYSEDLTVNYPQRLDHSRKKGLQLLLNAFE